MRNFDVFFDMRLNKRVSKQSHEFGYFWIVKGCFQQTKTINQRQVIYNSPRDAVTIDGLISFAWEKYKILSTCIYY